ncbi:serine hydrolase domain-containing protein [Flavobacterium psychrophilum]|uniref:serine hydrolase domain-containing protein n=1 Tax=Flavobacterium psychrophilum TaxID=96345 RepID=UPI000B7C0CB4|nr:serine hydrolase domain-containing protein [Flavobacterium psychrophilum]MBF2025066.1 serine hydrolase [Flavobacterium psychrophilum]MCB5984610.1 serine hydrolase [Flavobacterium psychrophilum]MCB5995535.1 serine hydrolase [Flavobacterium psychrophilum]MCB5997940.1 serine hydrolase [Flavobacterium psychrophilum]MCB6005445.1 serine hydrolase [Flavobacterium psychrophilum]
MKSILLATFLLFSIGSFSQKKANKQKAEKIDLIIGKYHQYDLFNGSALVVQNGKVLFQKNYGKADMGWNINATSDTKFRIGSITKQFTAMLIMQLKQEGKVNLDGKISDYLPWYNKSIGSKITIHHLLTHTSGLPNYTNFPDFKSKMTLENLSPKDFAIKYFKDNLGFEPGTKHSYCNTGYYLLGLIIEEVTNKQYEVVLQEKIFNVIGMKNTGIENPKQIISNFAQGYDFDYDSYQKTDYINMKTSVFSAGAMYSTANDMYLWDNALYSDILLNDENKKIYFTPYLNDYACGLVIQKHQNFLKSKKDITTMAHSGGINGFSCNIARIPENKIYVILLDNTRAGKRGGQLEAIIDDIFAILYNAEVSLPKPLVINEVYKKMQATTVEEGLVYLKDIKKNKFNLYNFNGFESEINKLAYKFLADGKIDSAVKVIDYNVSEFPNSFNVYDTRGEIYFAKKDFVASKKDYQKTLELYPNNDNAKEMLLKIEHEIGK